MKPADFLSNKTISVRYENDKWIITGQRRVISLSRPNLEMTIKAGPLKWLMLPANDNDLTVEAEGKRLSLSFMNAGKMEFSPYETGFKTGVKIVLRDFRQNGKLLDIELRLFVCLEGSSEELICELVAIEGATTVKECRWPKCFEPQSVNFTVIPFMQGMLLPRDWPRKVRSYKSLCMSYGRGLNMPWWGFQKDESAAMVILETPVDAGYRMEHPAGGPTVIELCWVHSLGKLRYPRRARICFFERGNYVTLAKRYRQYVIEDGCFVSLKDKIANRPIVGKLIGTPVIHTHIYSHIEPASSYYHKDDPSKNDELISFDKRADELKQLAFRGVNRAYVHLDGWGYRGYDNLHPDILPPCQNAGGWEGMRRFADTCEDLGFVFAIHDQYRDYYHDAASYQEQYTILNEQGERPFEHTWFGGNQSILCPSLAPGHVVKNHRALLAHNIKVKGAYLDVFAIIQPDECYNPEHPATRSDCLKYRGKCFALVKSLLGVVSSEEPVDWAVPHIDMAHHGPFATESFAAESGPARGIPVPLFNLVYHDAIVLPWSSARKKGQGWGIPDTDTGFLHCLVNAGVPYISINPDEEELMNTRMICALHRRVGLLEMTKHEFLDGNYRKQRTTFADGTTVSVDMESGEFDIRSELTDAELSRNFCQRY